MRDVSESLREALTLSCWDEPRLDLDVAMAEVRGEPIPYAEAVALPLAPMSYGDAWGVPWDTAWFRLRGAVPDGWAGSRVVASIDLGWPDGHPGFSLEALVWSGGEPVRGLCRFHEEVVVTRAARGGDEVDLWVEAAANPGAFPGAPAGVQHGADRLGVLRRAELVRVSPVARRARLLLSVLAEAGALDPAIVDDLLGGASPPDVLPALEKAFSGGGPGRPVLHAVANSHLDTAWLWPVRETRRKSARTLATALEVAADHPGHVFAVSQPQQLAWLEEDYPGLFARVRAAVADGSLEMVGVSWVEPDTNVPSGESLVRQLTYGARYLRERFGVSAGGLWLPDVFGYSAQLPQLLRQAGLFWFMTSKLGMNDTNAFPYRTFRWEGIDGSRVLAHMPPADTYNGSTALSQLREAAARDAEDTAGHALYLYGYGDGGGGPTVEMVERIAALSDLPDAPALARGTVASFFDALERDARDLPVWLGELYFELHRGTYTTQARTKAGNRAAQRALFAAELWSAAAGVAPTRLRALWERLLLQQFHDILPGSSIGWVHADAEAALDSVVAEARALADEALAPLLGSGEVVAVNEAPVARAEVVDGASPVWAVAPPLGWGPVSASLPEGVEAVRVDGTAFDNGLLRVEWDPDTAHLVSVRDGSREVLAGPGNVLQVHDDRPRYWDAWDVERRDLDRPVPLGSVVSLTVEAGPMVARLRVERAAGASTYVQTVALHAGSRLIRCSLDVDWQERHTLLKVAFPVAVRAARATYEIQYGAVERPTHRNTTWDAARFEVCAQRWADLSEAGYGVALLNDAKHGYDVHGSTMRLSLLRSPTWPDAEADRGRHVMSWALLPHRGSLAEVVGAAAAFDTPLRLVPGSGSRSVVATSDPGVVVSAVKPADDGDGVVVRLYEALGGRRSAVLATTLPYTEAVACDLHETPVGEWAPLGRVDLGAFEVRTLRLR